VDHRRRTLHIKENNNVTVPVGKPPISAIRPSERHVRYRSSPVDLPGLISKRVARRSMANGRNPISIIVPCHRVIGSTGRLERRAVGAEPQLSLL